MIKKYSIKENIMGEDCVWTLYVGSPATIKAMYNSIDRNNCKGTDLCGLFVERPSFNMTKSCYGLMVNEDSYISIINSDTVAYYLAGMDKEVVVTPL